MKECAHLVCVRRHQVARPPVVLCLPKGVLFDLLDQSPNQGMTDVQHSDVRIVHAPLGVEGGTLNDAAHGGCLQSPVGNGDALRSPGD